VKSEKNVILESESACVISMFSKSRLELSQNGVDKSWNASEVESD